MNVNLAIWELLRDDINTLTRRVDKTEKRSGIANTTFAFESSTLVNAPLAAQGMTTSAVRWITDGRKGGEGVGVGTGIPAYYNPATDEWLRFSDDTAVLV